MQRFIPRAHDKGIYIGCWWHTRRRSVNASTIARVAGCCTKRRIVLCMNDIEPFASGNVYYSLASPWKTWDAACGRSFGVL